MSLIIITTTITPTMIINLIILIIVGFGRMIHWQWLTSRSATVPYKFLGVQQTTPDTIQGVIINQSNN